MERCGGGGEVGIILDVGFSYPAVGVAEEEVGVVIGPNLAGGGGLYNLLYFDGDEVVEGVDVL